MQGGLSKLAGAAATVDTLSQDAQQQRTQLRASQVGLVCFATQLHTTHFSNDLVLPPHSGTVNPSTSVSSLHCLCVSAGTS